MKASLALQQELKAVLGKLSRSKRRTLKCALTGKALLTSPYFNKGTAFTEAEREQFGLHGLLPSGVQTLGQQVRRAYAQFQSVAGNLQKNRFLASLREQNEVLYFRLVSEHIKEMLPIIYTPTAGEVIANYSHLFRRPEGCFLRIGLSHKEVEMRLKSWGGVADIDYIIITDGEGILGIGDQGAGGIGISVAKAGLMTLCGGIHPNRVLPIVLDVGTNNDELLNDDLYLGVRSPRASGHKYDEFISMCLSTIKECFPFAVIHFEDFGLKNASRLLNYYQDKFCVFNDDIQGTGAVALAAVSSAALVANKNRKNLKIMIFGAGTAGMGIADQMKGSLTDDGISEEQAISQIYLVDRIGLLLKSHGDYLTEAQKPYAKDPDEWRELINGFRPISLHSAVQKVKPDVLLGCSGQPGSFTEDVIAAMSEGTEQPIILPISNPTKLIEARPSDILHWSDGNALIATGSPFPPVVRKGRKHVISECNNALVYPGIGLGCVLSRAQLLTKSMIKAGGDALALESPALDLEKNANGGLLPDVSEIRSLSKKVAAAVIRRAVEDGISLRSNRYVSSEETIPIHDQQALERWVETRQWTPQYQILEKVSIEEADTAARGGLGIGRTA